MTPARISPMIGGSLNRSNNSANSFAEPKTISIASAMFMRETYVKIRRYPLLVRLEMVARRLHPGSDSHIVMAYQEVVMKFRWSFCVLLAGLVFAPALSAQNCRINSVEPGSGKTGDMIDAAGDAVNAAIVEELYLTDGTNDFKVQIVEQNEKLIKFKVPDKVKAGRYSLMIKTKGKDTKLLEQPVRFTVEG